MPKPRRKTWSCSWPPLTCDWAAADPEGALRRLLDLLPRVGGDERDAVRERLVEYFDLLGPEDARVAPARREMARALF